MKIIIASIALALGFSAAVLPASAGYVSPNSSSLQQAFQHGD